MSGTPPPPLREEEEEAEVTATERSDVISDIVREGEASAPAGPPGSRDTAGDEAPSLLVEGESEIVTANNNTTNSATSESDIPKCETDVATLPSQLPRREDGDGAEAPWEADHTSNAGTKAEAIATSGDGVSETPSLPPPVAESRAPLPGPGPAPPTPQPPLAEKREPSCTESDGATAVAEAPRDASESTDMLADARSSQTSVRQWEAADEESGTDGGTGAEGLSRGNSFPRVMDISELVRMGSHSCPAAEDREEHEEGNDNCGDTCVAAADEDEEEEEEETTARRRAEDERAAAMLLPERRQGDASAAPAPDEEEAVGKDAGAPAALEASTQDANAACAVPAAAASREDTLISADANAGVPPPAASADVAVVEHVHEPITAPASVATEPLIRPLHREHMGDEEAEEVEEEGEQAVDRRACTAHLLRLRRTLLSAFPLQVRRYYTLSVTRGEHAQREDGSDRGTSASPTKTDGDGGGAPAATAHGRGPPCVCVPCEILEGRSVADVCAAAAKAEAALLHQNHKNTKRHRADALAKEEARGAPGEAEGTDTSLTVTRSSLSDVPKALPLLLDRLAEDKYFVHGAWQRFHEDTQFIKVGTSVAVRKRRRASVLASMTHEAAPSPLPSSLPPTPPQQPPTSWRRVTSGGCPANGSGAPHTAPTLEEMLSFGDGTTNIPTPRTVFTFKDWRAEAEDAVKSFKTKLATAAAAAAAPVSTMTGTVAMAQTGALSANTAASTSSVAAGGGGTPQSGAAPLTLPPSLPPSSSSGGSAAPFVPAWVVASTDATTSSGRRAPQFASLQSKAIPVNASPDAPATSALHSTSSHASFDSSAAAREGEAGPAVDSDVVRMHDVISREEMAMYARFAESSGRLRHEVTEPFSTLTVRAMELRKAQLLKKL